MCKQNLAGRAKPPLRAPTRMAQRLCVRPGAYAYGSGRTRTAQAIRVRPGPYAHGPGRTRTAWAIRVLQYAPGCTRTPRAMSVGVSGGLCPPTKIENFRFFFEIFDVL